MSLESSTDGKNSWRMMRLSRVTVNTGGHLGADVDWLWILSFRTTLPLESHYEEHHKLRR